jgi:hypothetical protein
MNLLWPAGFQSMRAEMQAVMHVITALLAMAMRRPEPNRYWHFESVLPPGRFFRVFENVVDVRFSRCYESTSSRYNKQMKNRLICQRAIS